MSERKPRVTIIHAVILSYEEEFPDIYNFQQIQDGIADERFSCEFSEETREVSKEEFRKICIERGDDPEFFFTKGELVKEEQDS